MPGNALSSAADQDIENIFEFCNDTFGLDQALSYQIAAGSPARITHRRARHGIF